MTWEASQNPASVFIQLRVNRKEMVNVMKLSIAILASLLTVGITNTPLRADSTNGPIYDVNGTMILTGNNVCTPSPCTETIQFSFQFGYQFTTLGGNFYSGYAIPGTISVTSSGNLGASFLTNGVVFSPTVGPNPGCSGGDANFMEFLDAVGDEIDLHECGNLEQSPIAPSFSLTSTLYGCATTTCINDFVPPSLHRQAPATGLFINGSAQTSVVAAPEGEAPMLGYLLISLAPIGLAICQRRGKGTNLNLAVSSKVR